MGRGMKAGKRPKQPKPQGGNMQKQIQQMQAMQKQMEDIQEELETREFTATAGGGAISVTASGAKKITSIKIEKDVVDPEDVEMLEDLVTAAVNEVLEQVDAVSEEEMGKVTGGLDIAGLM